MYYCLRNCAHFPCECRRTGSLAGSVNGENDAEDPLVEGDLPRRSFIHITLARRTLGFQVSPKSHRDGWQQLKRPNVERRSREGYVTQGVCSWAAHRLAAKGSAVRVYGLDRTVRTRQSESRVTTRTELLQELLRDRELRHGERRLRVAEWRKRLCNEPNPLRRARRAGSTRC